MDYINPFSAMGGDPTIESPFLRSMDRGTRQNLAAPFIEMAQQNQQMDLNKKGMETSEFMSPQAQQLRQQTRATGLLNQQEQARALPYKTNQEISDAQAAIARNPAITAKMIAEADQAGMKAKGSPAADLFNKIATGNKYLRDNFGENVAGRQFGAQAIIEQWKAEHPGAQLPEIMTKYDPIKWDLAEHITLNSISHRQKMDEVGTKEKAHDARTSAEIAGRERVAEIGANARTTAAASRGNAGPRTDAQFRNHYQSIILSPDASDEDKAIARTSIKPYVEKDVVAMAKAAGLDIIRDKTSIAKIRQKYYSDYGITDDAPAPGAPAPASGGSEKDLAVKTFGAYEPDKYEYKVVNGRLGRRPKGNK